MVFVVDRMVMEVVETSDHNDEETEEDDIVITNTVSPCSSVVMVSVSVMWSLQCHCLTCTPVSHTQTLREIIYKRILYLVRQGFKMKVVGYGSHLDLDIVCVGVDKNLITDH